MSGTERRDVGGAQVDVARAGTARIRRLIYPVGFRWSVNVKPLVESDYCMHAHVGFLARGHIEGRYADGCAFDYVAPAVMVIEPGHDAWVIGTEPAVLIEVDFERDTLARLGLKARHAP